MEPMKILVLNCGSSSIKFGVFQSPNEKRVAQGIVEEIGANVSSFTFQKRDAETWKKEITAKDHGQALDVILKELSNPKSGVLQDIFEIDAVGHRVVHGGEMFSKSACINEAVFQKIKDCVDLAPLHNPPNIQGIQASLWHMPFARQVAVFDTAFHQSMEPQAFLYALPYAWYEKFKIRRYGFHGTSHQYVAQRVSKIVRTPLEDLKLIVCHLGNGASVTAVDHGKSVDTSMGFTPLEGLVMGTRCGDIDPAIPLHMIRIQNMSANQLDQTLNKKSGFYGITGGDNDLRIIEQKAEMGSEKHQLALEMFSRRVKKYIGAYAAIMGGLDGVVFTGGIGENSGSIRKMICEGLDFLGIELHSDFNNENRTCISTKRTAVFVIPTDEEMAIAHEVIHVLEKEMQFNQKAENFQ